MDGYLTKPLEPEALYAELCRWLRLPANETAIERTTPVPGATQRALPGFDAARVERWFKESPDAWRSMVRTFVAGYPEAVAAIRTALDTGDRTCAVNLLHRLRGAGGALGAVELSEAARQLELALAEDGPVDAGLRARFFACAEAALAALTTLKIPAVEEASVGDATPGCGERSQRIRELEALLEAGNTRALDHLRWLERCLGAEAPAEGVELVRQIEALDFPAALETLRGLGEGAFTGPR